MNRVEAARRSGSRPPWTIPKIAWSGARVGRQRSLRPAVGPLGRVGDDGARRAREDRLVEGDRDVRAERLLDADRDLRREPVERAVEVAPERDAVIVDDPQVTERDDLEPARVGQDRAVPVHEPMQPAEPGDPLVPRAQVQVVGVGQDDRGARSSRRSSGRQRLDRGVRADRHELRGLDDAVGQRQSPGPCPRRAVGRRRDEDLVVRRAPRVWGRHASGVSGGSTIAGRSHRPGIPGSWRRGGGIS